MTYDCNSGLLDQFWHVKVAQVHIVYPGYEAEGTLGQPIPAESDHVVSLLSPVVFTKVRCTVSAAALAIVQC